MPTKREPEEDAQMSLLGADMSIVQEEERKGHFTGQRLKALRPDAYAGIVEGLAQGLTQRGLARIYKVSANTVGAIVLAESVAIESLREQLGRKATMLQAQLMEEIEADLNDSDKMRKTSFKDKLVASNILNEQAQLAQGKPTEIHAHRITADDLNEDFFAGLPKAQPADAPKTGFSGEAGQQKGELLETVPGEFVPAADQAGELGGDCKSPVHGAQVVEDQQEKSE